MLESHFLSIIVSSIVTYLIWIRSKNWLKKNIKSKIITKSDKKIYLIFFCLTLFAHFALLIFIVFFIRKLEKFIVIIFLVLSAYAAYLYFSGNETTDKQNEILKDPKKLLEESL